MSLEINWSVFHRQRGLMMKVEEHYSISVCEVNAICTSSLTSEHNWWCLCVHCWDCLWKKRHKRLIVEMISLNTVTTPDKVCEKKKGCICIDSVLLWSLVFTGVCQFLLWMRARPIICRWDSQLILRHDSGSDSDTSAHLALTVNTRRNMRYNKPTVILSAEIGQRRIYFSVDISRQLNSETQTC